MSQRTTGKPARVKGSPPRAGSNARLADHTARAAVHQAGRWPAVVICLLLALAVWVVFGQTLRHEFVNFDDNEYVYENPIVIQGLTPGGIAWAMRSTVSSQWQPVTLVSHMLACELYGLNAGGHHLINLLLHTANVLLVFLVLKRMTGARWRSALVAALFAVHPLRVESVAWVTERKDVLSGLFFLLTLWAYVRYALCKMQNAKCKTRNYLLALGFFALGLMSKATVVTLPFVLLLLDWWPLRRFQFATFNSQRSTVKQLVLEKLPFFLLSAAASVVTIRLQGAGGSLASAAEVPAPTRLLNALVSYTRYLAKTIWPDGLAVYYPYPKAFAGSEVMIALAVLGGATVLAVWGWRRAPYVTVGWLWFMGMLVPVSGLVQAGEVGMADRFTYLPHMGLLVVVVWGAVEVCGGWRHGHAVLRTAAAAILTGLMVLAYVQTTHWKNSVSLWTHTVACTSGNSGAQNNLGAALAAQGKWAEAMEHYARALQLRPDNDEAHNNLGVELAKQGRLAEAMEHYERALQLRPDHAGVHNNSANALARQGKLTEAIAHYERALELKPDQPEAHSNFGMALAMQGKWTEAIGHYKRALQLQPDNGGAHYNLGIALAVQGNLIGARQHFEQALKLAAAQGNAALAEAVRARLRSYQESPPQPNSR